MIQSLQMPQLSSAKPRVGLNRFADLVALLVKQYELQSRLDQKIQQRASNKSPIIHVDLSPTKTQTTFSWDDMPAKGIAD
jgi:hypothetical protein